MRYSGAIYHVMDRGYRREDIFQSDNGRRLILETLRQAFEKPVERGWRLGARNSGASCWRRWTSWLNRRMRERKCANQRWPRLSGWRRRSWHG